jgi:histone acetyltransferase (RNA polymerase elongator complex component)
MKPRSRSENPPRPFIIPVFVPQKGCPHRCVFCNQVSIIGTARGEVSRDAVGARISEFLGYRGNRRDSVQVAFYGGNFLGLSEAYRLSLLEEAEKFVEQGKVDGIRFSTRPETVTPESLAALAPYSVQTIEVGAQSMDDEILSISQRGHTARDTENAVGRVRGCGREVGIQIMPGLPGDTAESILETGRRVAALQPDFVRIYPTVVVRNTLLETWYHAGRFVPLSLDDAVELTKGLYLLFKAAGVSVIRMGLQDTESLSRSGGLVAGPFHPAFGHLVHSAVFLDLAVQALERRKAPGERVAIRAHPHDVSKVRGLRNDNVTELTMRFHLKQLQVLDDLTVPRGTLRIEALAQVAEARPKVP